MWVSHTVRSKSLPPFNSLFLGWISHPLDCTMSQLSVLTPVAAGAALLMSFTCKSTTRWTKLFPLRCGFRNIERNVGPPNLKFSFSGGYNILTFFLPSGSATQPPSSFYNQPISELNPATIGATLIISFACRSATQWTTVFSLIWWSTALWESWSGTFNILYLSGVGHFFHLFSSFYRQSTIGIDCCCYLS